MVANIRGYTPNYEFRLINFDTPRWHTLEYANWLQLDAMLLSAGIAQVRGEWQHNTLYRDGDRVFDGQTNELYRCTFEHTSPATGTFEEYRLTHTTPSHWVLQLPGTPVFMGPWAPNVQYALGDIVHDAYRYYLCTSPHLSGATFTGAEWQLIFDATAAVDAAEGFADDAEGFASAASTSASNAATSELNAHNSEVNAGKSEDDAFTWQSNASTYASNAQTYMNNAQTAQTNAETAETNAETAQGLAETAASNASGYADAAAASAGAVLTANAFPWKFSTTTTMADPGAGNIRLNNATLSSVTQIAISALTAAPGNPSVSNWIMSWDDGNGTVRGQIIIRENATPQNFAIYNVTGTITPNGTAGIVPVAYVTHANGFALNDMLNVEFTRSGNDGTSGTGSGDMLKSENLFGLASYPDARANMGLGLTSTPTFNGMTLTGALTLPAGTPANDTDATNKAYVVGLVNGLSGSVTTALADKVSKLPAGDTMAGNLTISKSTPELALNKSASGQIVQVVGQTAGLNRWGVLLGNSTPETGTEVGSDLSIRAYKDNGIDFVPALVCNRATALFNVAGDPTTPFGIATKQSSEAAASAAASGKVNRVGDTMTGTLGVAPPAANATITLSKPTGAFTNDIWGQVAGNARWLLRLGNETAESGGTTGLGGSDFALYYFNNNASTIDTAISISRTDGRLVIKEPQLSSHAATKTYVDLNAANSRLSFWAFPNAAQTLLNETWTKINFGSTAVIKATEYVGAHYNHTISRWSPPTGMIRISALVTFSSGLLMGTPINIEVRKNGAFYSRVVGATVSFEGTAHITMIDIAAAGDYYEVWAFVYTNTNAVVNTTSYQYTQFHGEQV